MFLLQLSLLYHYLHGTTTQPRHDTQQQSNNHRIVLCFSTNPSTFCIVIQIVHGTQLRSMKQPISNNRCVVLEGNLIACNSCSLAPSLSLSPSFLSFHLSFFLSLNLSISPVVSWIPPISVSHLQTFHSTISNVSSPPQTPPLTHFPTPWLACFPLFPGLWFILPSFALTTPQPPSHPCRVRFW